jgi:hypothetical protein
MGADATRVGSGLEPESARHQKVPDVETLKNHALDVSRSRARVELLPFAAA